MKLRHFYKIDQNKQPVPGSNVKRLSKPGKFWKEIKDPCCEPTEIDCTCGPRFFVQIDGIGKPVPGSLIKRFVFPRMENGIKYMEIDWKSVCCAGGDGFEILYSVDTDTDISNYQSIPFSIVIPPGVTYYFEAQLEIYGLPSFGGSLDAFIADDSLLVEWVFSDVSEGIGTVNGWTVTAAEPTTTINAHLKGAMTNTSGDPQEVKFFASYTVPYFSQTSPCTIKAGSIFKYGLTPVTL